MAAENANNPAMRDWITTICLVLIGLYALIKIYLLVVGQSLLVWLDFTNPSIIGLIFSASVVTLIIRRLVVKKRDKDESKSEVQNSSDVSIDGGWGVVILSGVTGFYGVLLIADALLPSVGTRGNPTSSIQVLPLVAGVITVIVAVYIYKGANWGRWVICAAPVVGIYSGLTLGTVSFPISVGALPILASLLLFVPLLLTKKSRKFFRHVREKKHAS